MNLTSIGEKTRNLGIVRYRNEDILTVASARTGNFLKYYLGQTGRTRIGAYIGMAGLMKLDPGWEDARFAFVIHPEVNSPLGIVAEYPDGNFVFVPTEPDRLNGKRATFTKLANEFIELESRTPALDRLKSWEEISAGAAITEAFTSKKTNTGLWGIAVPVVNDECNDCLKCYIQCPDESIYRNPILGIAELIDPTKCKDCGICAEVCPRDAITMVDKEEVSHAKENVFTGIYGKRMEVSGPNVKNELEELTSLAPEKLEAKGYRILYADRSGEKSLSGKPVVQYRLDKKDNGKQQYPELCTFIGTGEENWKKVIRPLARILVYGYSAEDLELASRIQLDGFAIRAIASGTEGYNGMQEKFVAAEITSSDTLDAAVDNSKADIDAVVTAYFENVPKETYLKIREEIGTFMAPFMKNFSRDKYLDGIVRDVQSKMLGNINGFEDDERPLAKVLRTQRDISSGHRACAGCPVYSTFNLTMQSVREAFDTEEEQIEIVNSGATGCSEVVTSVFPDTSWRKFLHTVFGGLGANLEGMNAAYRYLFKTGRLTKKYKFFGWAGDGGTYDIGLQALSGFLERGLATDSVYICYDNGAYMNTGVQRSSATPMGAGTSTSPIGEIVRGKPQFRKNLAEFATAHAGVYVATVSIAYEMDFKSKMQKAAMHDGPALIIAYSNCTTGHNTGTHLTVQQSKMAVDCGYWPLFEFVNGEKTITFEPPFVRKYESAKQKVKQKFAGGKESKAEALAELEELKANYQNEFTNALADWLRSEGRFAMHFDKKGDLKNAESVALLMQLFEELKIEWNKLRVADRDQKRKDKLISVLIEYQREEDEKVRKEKMASDDSIFGLNGAMMAMEAYVANHSIFDASGNEIRKSHEHMFSEIRRLLDTDAYFDMYHKELESHDPANPQLTDELRGLGKTLSAIYLEEQVKKEEIEKKAYLAETQKLRIIKERIKEAHATNYLHSMDKAARRINRAILGDQPKAARIFARAGDGGVTTAKLFVSLLGQIGIFGKAAPDYGPERRGAPVGTNIQFGGKELRTQASYSMLDISMVKNPDDKGWSPAQWRDTVKQGGTLIINTTLSPEDCRLKYMVRDDITLYTFDATDVKQKYRVPETVTLMGVALRSLADKGLEVQKEYLDERWQAFLNKEFAAKAARVRIVEKNQLALWEAFEGVNTDGKPAEVDRSKISTEGFELSPPAKLMTGSESVAEAWRQINPGVFAMFPITPSTEVGQVFSQFWADGKVDTEYIHTESEHSSFMTIIAAGTCGVRAVTSTASQGMLLGKEGGLLAASLRLPLVVNVGSRETNAPLSIHAGHTDSYQFRDDGWLQFYARNAQQAYDFAIIAQKVAEKARLPVFLNQDGFIVTHTKDMLDILTDQQVKDFVGDYFPEENLLTKDMTLNPISLQDYYSEHVKQAHNAQEAVPAIINEVMAEFAELTGRNYRRTLNYKTEDADVAIVCMGSTEGTTMDAIDKVRERGIKAGLVSIKNYRPFPTEEIAKALADAPTVIVMDRMGSLGTQFTPLGTEVKAALGRPILNLEYGRGGRNTPRRLVEDIFEIGITVGKHGIPEFDTEKVKELIKKDELVKSLLSELTEVRGTEFADRFQQLVTEGKWIEAFGPKEHIDVREKTRQRDLKLSILERIHILLRRK